MNRSGTSDQEFIRRVTKLIEENLKNESFNVSELSSKLGVSRSTLYLKVKSITQRSVSKFICEIRLKKALQLLQNSDLNVSEIAFEVGFNSPSYFIKCFHEYYGFSPGEVELKSIADKLGDETENLGMHETPNDPKIGNGSSSKITISQKRRKISKFLLVLVAAFTLLLIVGFLYTIYVNDFSSKQVLSSTVAENSLVVLPFINLGENQDNQYFADGIKEDILNNLYWITSLRLASRTSSDKYRDSSLSVSQIAEDLNVRYVLEGSVRQYGDTIRISVQLIDAPVDEHIWSSVYDRELKDIISLQDEIALEVATQMKAVLSEKEIQQIEKIPTKNPHAYENYLRARFLLHQANSEQRSGFEIQGVMNSIPYYEKAIEEDPDFAMAYAGLANAWAQLSAWGILGTPEGFIKAKEYSLKALELDPNCAGAHAVLGAVNVWYERKIEEGGKELLTSIQLNPNFATARQWYAQYLMITGPIKESRKQVDRAVELEPYFWVVQNLSAWVYYFEEKHEKAIETCEIARDLNPQFLENNWLFFLNYTKLGEGEKAMQELQNLVSRYPDAEGYKQEIQTVFEESGIDGLYHWLIDINENRPIPLDGLFGDSFFIAWWYAILGDQEQTLFWLEKVLEQERRLYHYFNLITTNPDFEFIRENPRFLKVVDEIGLLSYLQ